MSSSQIRVLLCDDHELVREGLKRILLETGTVKSIGDASNAAEALEAVRKAKWDIVILDINLGARTGLEVLKEIKAEYPQLPVLVLSIYPEEQFALRVIREGASGYLNKNLAGRTLVEAIKKVTSGGKFVSEKVAEQLMHAVAHPTGQPRYAALSTREDQVMRRIAAGETVGEIAKTLNLSVRTVSTYRTLVLKKLGLKNNAQIMRYAHEHRLSG